MASKKQGGAANPFAAALKELRSSLPDATKPVAAHADLEAAIIAAPDDAGAFLVYGDALQAAGDPRGTLIALQHALSETPRSKKKKELLDAFMKEHRRYFLGSIEAAVEREDVKLEWSLGFIRRAKLFADSLEETTDLLLALLDLPSARFMRELQILVPSKFPAWKPWSTEAMKIVQQMIRIARPVTLERLLIEKMGGWTPPPDLYTAFPRLSKDASSAWEMAMKRATAEKRLTVRVVDDLPALEPRADVHVTVDAIDKTALFRGLRAEIEKGRSLGLIEAMRNAFTEQSRDAWVLALTLALTDENGDDWPVDLMGLIGGERCIEWIAETAPVLVHERAVQAMAALGRIDTDLAICALRMLWATPSRLSARRAVAASIIGSIAKERDLRAEQLLDRVCSRPLSTALRPASMSIVVAARRTWLLDLMITGRNLPIGEFQGRIAKHASLLPFATGLVFEHVDRSRSRSRQCFRLDLHGTWRDVNGVEIAIGEKGSVGIPHPIEMESKDVIDAWRAQLLAARQSPPILQLDRPLFALTNEERASTALGRFADRRLGFRTLARRFEQVDWRADYEEERYVRTFTKNLPRGGIRISAILNDDRDAVVSVAVLDTNHPRLRLSELHPVAVSELLYELDEVTSPPS